MIRGLVWVVLALHAVTPREGLRYVSAEGVVAQPFRAAGHDGSLKFDAARAWEHLRQLVAIGPRPSGSPAIEQTRTYIRQQLGAAGLTATEQAWDEQTPIDKVRMVNLIATIPGARKERIVFAGHYDTKLYRQFRFVGASDGGSSAAFLLELARALKARKNPLTIELLFLDGEEARLPDWHGTDNTYGSRHYVDLAKRDGSLTTLKALVLVDMIGDRDLNLRRDTWTTTSSPSPRKSRTTTCRSWRPACRPWTSSTSTTRLGTRRTTPSTRSAPEACRSSATSSSARCRRLKRVSQGSTSYR
jgi:hypothetical protein